MKKPLLTFIPTLLFFMLILPIKAHSQEEPYFSSAEAIPARTKTPGSSDEPRMPFPPAKHRDIMNYNGRKMPKRSGFFSIIGVKVDEAGETLVFSIYFNDAVDTNSVLAHQILIEEKPLPPETEFLFNRSRRMMRFELPRPALYSIKAEASESKNFSMKIFGLKAFDGKPMKPTEFQKLTANTFIKYGRAEQKWEKF